MIDILYLARNRRRFTEATLAALLANTDWALVRRMVLYDDGSTDGTADVVSAFSAPVPVEIRRSEFGSPVAVMNHFLSADAVAPIFAKLDNDTMVPPGWLVACLAIMERNPLVDLLGIEPMGRVDIHAEASRTVRPAEFIGGIGLMRSRAFSGELPEPNGRFGFTAWQDQRTEVVKAWLDPALPVCLLDRVPFEPWRSLSAQYVAAGWQRPWGPYAAEQSALWEWWA